MKILPIENITLVSNLRKEELLAILSENLQKKRGLRFGFTQPKNQKLFEGYLYNDSFEIQRVINYRNSFLPQISGKISTRLDKARIELKLKPHSFVLVFISLWLGGVGLGLIGSLIGIFTQGVNPLACLPLIVMFGFGIGLTNFGFKTESKKAKNDLTKIFKARIEEKTFTNNTYK
tara:strand:+ start:45 stop:572 length:528 start_codon:yes stop_codon:yes gene_type:complete